MAQMTSEGAHVAEDVAHMYDIYYVGAHVAGDVTHLCELSLNEL